MGPSNIGNLGWNCIIGFGFCLVSPTLVPAAEEAGGLLKS